jgi:hypothetical protein
VFLVGSGPEFWVCREDLRQVFMAAYELRNVVEGCRQAKTRAVVQRPRMGSPFAKPAKSSTDSRPKAITTDPACSAKPFNRPEQTSAAKQTSATTSDNQLKWESSWTRTAKRRRQTTAALGARPLGRYQRTHLPTPVMADMEKMMTLCANLTARTRLAQSVENEFRTSYS